MGLLRMGRLLLRSPIKRIHHRHRIPQLDAVRRARIYATALGLYELSVNGRRVGCDFFAPGFTDYTQRIHFQTYDVAPLLARGENVMGVVLGDGWFAGRVASLPRNHGRFGAGPSHRS